MCAIEKGSGPVQLLTSIERKSGDIWKAPHVSCWAGGCCNIVVRFGSFVYFKSLLCSHEDYETVPWAQMWGRPPLKERNAATNSTHRKAPTFTGAVVILCTPCSFCFAWGGVKKNNKRFYFHIFLPPHLLIHLHSQKKRKEPVFTCSNCTCFTASSLQKKEQNNKKSIKLEGKCQQETRYTVGVCAHRELGSVFTVNHTIWDGCTRCRPEFYQV